MRCLSLILILVAILFATSVKAAGQGTVPDANTRKDLEQLERDWIEVQDRDKLAKMVSDDFIYIDAEANVLNKQQYLDTVSRVQIKNYVLKDVVTRLYGDIAIVTNTWSGTYSFDGKETTETLRYTDVFQRVKKGSWQAISSHATRVPRPK